MIKKKKKVKMPSLSKFNGTGHKIAGTNHHHHQQHKSTTELGRMGGEGVISSQNWPASSL